ncbi:hypothetical protein HKCCE4037_13365 [Rhodobacterales bacterium HKCCE4037]|nr:hypothetical protein [Rhodobacterales bacterium HKCCE4037]
MSAPDTNVEKQARNHRPSLIGIALALIIAGVAAVFFIGWDAAPDGEQAAPALVEDSQ